jgi:hypothetical protein
MLVLVSKTDIGALKAFARTMIWAFPLVFMGLLPWFFEQSIHWWPAVISAVLLVLYFVYPTGIYYPYRIWMAIAGVLGWINTRIILAVAFYLLIFPIGLLMRSLGKLQYQTKIEKTDSFWIKREQKLTKDNLKEPF